MLISLEGIDGSGKTTVWEALQRDEETDAVFTREPTDSWYGDAVRRSIADDEADPVAELFLYTADHAAHLSNTIRPALDRGAVVITDRYVDSRYAYQGTALDGSIPDPMEYVRSLHRPITREPDLTFLLEIDPALAVERTGVSNKFERETFLQGVAKRYDLLAERSPDRFVRIDGTQDPGIVLDRVRGAIRSALETSS